ncbi:MAG: hypothetical protein QM831_12660 [Kofleriaceae bacterium]
MSEIRDLLREVLAASDRVAACIEHWSRENYGAGVAAQRLATLSLEIAKEAAVRARRRLDEMDAGATISIEAAKALYLHVASPSDLFELLEHSSRRSLHPVLSPMVQRQLAMLHIEGDVLVTSIRDVSYELNPIDEVKHSRLVRTAYLVKRKPILVFRVPHPPLDRAMHHVLLFHEIGHAVFQSLGIDKSFPIPQELQPASTDLTEQFEIRKRQLYYATCANRWYEELFSDVIGLELAGPAYVFAFFRVLAGTFGIAPASPTHPPTGLRILLMIRSLEERGLVEPLPNQAKALLRDWSARVEKLDTDRAYASSVKEDGEFSLRLLPILVREMMSAYSGVRQEAAAVIPEYTVVKLAEDLARGHQLFSRQIPPIEVDTKPTLTGPGTPLDAARVFAACWCAYMLSLDSETPLKSETLDKVLLESLDGAESLRTWREL